MDKLDEIGGKISTLGGNNEINIAMTAGTEGTPITEKIDEIDKKLVRLGDIGSKSMAQIAKELGDPNWDNAASALVPESADYNALSDFGKAYVDTLDKVSSAGGDVWNFWYKSIDELNSASGGLFDQWLNPTQAKASAETLERGIDKVVSKVNDAGSALRKVYDTSTLLDKNVETTQAKWRLEEKIEAETRAREAQLEIQRQQFELTKRQMAAEARLNEEKAKLLASGKPLINVTVDPAFQPAAGEILRSLIEMAQMQANATGLEGIGLA